MAGFNGQNTGGCKKPGEQGGFNSSKPFNQGGNKNKSIEPPINFPIDYLSYGYSNKNGERDVKYITVYPEQISKFLVDFKEATAYSKMRSYYEEAVNIRTAYSTKKFDMGDTKCKLGLLVPRARHSEVKGIMHKGFEQFIRKNITYVISVVNEADFRVELSRFIEHFEAVICLVYRKKK